MRMMNSYYYLRIHERTFNYFGLPFEMVELVISIILEVGFQNAHLNFSADHRYEQRHQNYYQKDKGPQNNGSSLSLFKAKRQWVIAGFEVDFG